MPIENVATAALILVGAFVMGLSLHGTRIIRAMLGRGPYADKWRVLSFLMLFFLLGYLASLFLVLFGFSKFLALVTGVIFLSGAAFVNLVVRVGQQTISDLLTTTVSNAHFGKIIDSMVGALVVTDVDFVVRKVNQATLSMSGYREEELVGRPIDTVFSDCGLLDRRNELMRKGCFADMEKECRNTDGGPVPVSVSGSIIRGSEGQAEGVVFVFQDISERKQLEGRLYYNATHDPLTGLPNRALLIDRLRHALKRADRHEEYRFAVLFLDLDRFKLVNDSLGHAVGDRLLIDMAIRLHRCIREADTVARLGGDEYVFIIDDISDASDALRVADRIQKDLAVPFLAGAQELPTSASIGVVLSESRYESPEDVLRDADVAMYRAKSGGGARYEVFDCGMRDRMIGRLTQETELRRAIDQEELRVHYQPIIALESNRLVGFEALVRWKHPERGLIPPVEFVPLAEETGMIVGVDRLVMRAACAKLRRWQQTYPADPPLTINVNISCVHFQEPDLVPYVAEVLRETGLLPGSLRLEITESAFVDSLDSITDTLERLKRLGVELSIDDFGKGYSSLSYLHRLPVDTLKIDRSFVGNMSHNESNLAIVETIVLLARALNIQVVAEGVETGQQLHQLSGLHCDFVQGYYFSRPVAADVAEALITRFALASGESRPSSQRISTP